MNKNILIAVFIAIAFPISYFFYLEGFDFSVFSQAPSKFITQATDLFGLSGEKTQEEIERQGALDFLESLPEVDPSNTKEVVIQKEDSVSYEVTLVSEWSSQNHGNYFSEEAQVSPVIAWSHTFDTKVFNPGAVASQGIEEMAELGGIITLEQELLARRENGIFRIETGSHVESPGKTSVVMDVQDSHPYVSLVAKVYPSPDWFIGLDSVSLVENDTFVDELIVPISLYDAGTESGSTFSIKNDPTDPKDPIKLLDDIPTGSLPAFGKIIFKKIK